MQKRKIKDLLYEQVSFVGKVLSNPKRLELVEVLCPGIGGVRGGTPALRALVLAG